MRFKRTRSPEDNKCMERQVKRYQRKEIVPEEKKIVIPKITDSDLSFLLKELAERKLIEFLKQAWHVLEPETVFVDGWHLHAVCDHLEAVAKGEIRRLLINIPPRHAKSLTASVAFPCWWWTRQPAKRLLFSSYSSDLSLRDGDKSISLINSEWYQKNWGDKVELIKETPFKVENSMKGYRIATSVGGMTTGEGGDMIGVDDPHNAKEIESEPKRIGVLRWWDEVMSTRLNDQRTGAKIIIMQRLHEKDLSGHVLAKDNEYVHLCLPARYETDREKTYVWTGWSGDPRTKDGEVLWEEKFPDPILRQLEKDLGEYAAAGQLQQRPSPRGGGIFKVQCFKRRTLVDLHEVKRAVRYWDKAGTQDGGKFTCGVLMFLMRDDSFFVYDVVAGQWNERVREKRIAKVIRQDTWLAKRNKFNYCAFVEQEPGSAGKESAQATIRRLKGFRVYADRVTGDKTERATDFAVQVEAENVYLLDTDWTEMYIKRMEFFPMGEFKDWGDASSGAFNKLLRAKRAGKWGSKRGRDRR